MPSTPTYRTYVLPCPANAGKVKALTQWVIQWRELAELEKAYQLRRFRLTGGQLGLERAAKGGWSRPWVTDGRCFMKTEIYRLVARWVARVSPSGLLSLMTAGKPLQTCPSA